VVGFFCGHHKMTTRLFVSYTLRDSVITSEMLAYTKSLFAPFADAFVDVLSPPTRWHPQLTIFLRLLRAHAVVVIESDGVYKSPWVRLELFLARLMLKPIVRIPLSTLSAGHNAGR
jgi:hypothetical protein